MKKYLAYFIPAFFLMSPTAFAAGDEMGGLAQMLIFVFLFVSLFIVAIEDLILRKKLGNTPRKSLNFSIPFYILFVIITIGVSSYLGDNFHAYMRVLGLGSTINRMLLVSFVLIPFKIIIVKNYLNKSSNPQSLLFITIYSLLLNPFLYFALFSLKTFGSL